MSESPSPAKEPTLDVETSVSASLSGAVESDDPEKAPQPDVQHTRPPAPDGGTTAWLVVLGCWCASFCSFGWLNSIGVFQEYYQTELLAGYPSSTIAWISSLQIFFMMGMGPVVGTLYDRFGPRHLMLGGSLLHVLGIMMASLSTEYYQILLAQGVCSGIGASAVFQPSMTCVVGWFDKNRGAAMGVVVSGSSIGGIIFPVLVSRLISSVGFAWAMRVCGFLLLGLLIIANVTVRPLHPPTATTAKVTGKQLVAPLTEPLYLLLVAGFMCFSLGFYVPINYIPLEAETAGMDPYLASYLLPMLNAGSLFGRLLAGVLGDKVGRYNVFIVVCALSGVWILALWLPISTDPALIAFSILFGFFSGAYVSLLTPLVMSVVPIHELGLRTGIVLFFMAIAGLITNPISGAILDGSGGWVGLKVFCGVFCLVGTAWVLWARLRQTKGRIFVRF